MATTCDQALVAWLFRVKQRGRILYRWIAMDAIDRHLWRHCADVKGYHWLGVVRTAYKRAHFSIVLHQRWRSVTRIAIRLWGYIWPSRKKMSRITDQPSLVCKVLLHFYSRPQKRIIEFSNYRPITSWYTSITWNWWRPIIWPFHLVLVRHLPRHR